MTIMVPKTQAEAPSAGRDNVFPEGNWIGTIDTTRSRSFPEWVTEKSGYASKDGEILSIQLGNNVSADGADASPGAQKVFVDFVVRDGNASIEDGANIPDASWQLKKSAAMLTNLALALGATEDVELEGETYVAVVDGFLDQLRDQELDGASVGFNVKHRKWEKKGDGGKVVKSGTEVIVTEFFQAV